MKKILAVLLSLVMAFSFIVPAFAADETVEDVEVTEDASLADSFGSVIDSAEGICDSFKAEDYKGVATGVFAFAENLFIAIHDLVHSLSEMFDFDCPFCDDKKEVEEELEQPEDLYESAGTVIGEAFADKDMYFRNPYPISVDAGYVFTVPTKSITLDGIATAYVKSAIILEEGATTGKIVFDDTDTYNYFHDVEGFKILHNYSGAPVAIVLKGEVRVGSTNITAANIGDYIVGPYTVTVL